MEVWSEYRERLSTYGSTLREASLKRERDYINRKIMNSLSYQTCTVNEEEKQVAIVNTDNLDVKFIYALPGDTIASGSVVVWNDEHWLVIEKDDATEVYTKAKMQECNHLLRWVTSDGVIHQCWSIVSDGTRYLTGEFGDRDFIVTRGDERLQIVVPRNEETVALGRNQRFLIDDEDVVVKRAFKLTKPLKIGKLFSKEGVFSFVMQEVNNTETDNHELGIADYYKYYDRATGELLSNDESTDDGNTGGTATDDNDDNNGGWL